MMIMIADSTTSDVIDVVVIVVNVNSNDIYIDDRSYCGVYFFFVLFF